MPVELSSILLVAILGSVVPAFLGIWLERFLAIAFTKKITMALALGVVLFLFLDLMEQTAQLGIELRSPITQSTLWATFALAAIALVWAGNSGSGSVNRVALAWAVGVAFHSAGEGVVVGADALSGAFDLTITQAASFGLHKAFEGLSIGSLLSDMRPKLAATVQLALIAGLPTSFGVAATILGLPFSASTILFAAGAGSCIFPVLRLVPTPDHGDYRSVAIAVIFGLLLMYAAGLLHEI